MSYYLESIKNSVPRLDFGYASKPKNSASVAMPWFSRNYDRWYFSKNNILKKKSRYASVFINILNFFEISIIWFLKYFEIIQFVIKQKVCYQ
jgi:hypothetical protein